MSFIGRIIWFYIIFYSWFINNPLDDIKIFKQNNSTSDFSILILLLILYLILSGLKNSFRVTTINFLQDYMRY